MQFKPSYLIPGYGLLQSGWDVGTEIGNYLTKPLVEAVNKNKQDSVTRSYGSYNGDWLQYLKDMAADGDEASLDRLMNYMMQEQSNQTARDWTAQREDTAIQRFVADAKAAGFNPQALLQQGGSPIASASSGASYNGTPYLSSDYNKNRMNLQWSKLILDFTASVFKSVISGTMQAAGTAAKAFAG